MKYRIVRRNKSPFRDYVSSYDYYYAQMKLFGRWIDCRLNPFIDVDNTYDVNLSSVESWVNRQINGKQPIEEEVVKTYE
jgi:hypothetical protein